MELVFNDLSTKIPANNITSGRELMNNFVLICKLAINNGAERSLRTTENFFSQILTPEYSIGHWLSDPDVDKEFQRFIRSLAHKAPYIDFDFEKEMYERLLGSDFKFDGESVNGLGAAYLLDGFALSLKTEVRWNTSKIPLVMEFIDEDGNIVTENIEVNHASSQIHIQENEEWFNIQKVKKVQDGKELWNHKESIFPYLLFCDNVKGQIKDFHFGQPLFRQIIKRLFELNSYFSRWSEGPFEPELFSCKVTPESKETLNRFSSEHTFDYKDRSLLFSWHARMTPGAWRLFFVPDDQFRKGIIGYIGPKLPNVTYPT
jgi:hypothetical protein